MFIQTDTFTLRPVRDDEKLAVLEVYRQCEDFLALTPKPIATMQMVEDDLAISRESGGVFCGIYNSAGVMMGILDVVLKGFEGDPRAAFIELLMIGKPYRDHGLGSEVVKAVEAEITKDNNIKAILSGVMVNNPDAVRFWQRHGYQIVAGPDLLADGTTVWSLKKTVSVQVN
jgi:ribosomal protein S18 acetylase RimI-like enzyme